MDRYPDKDVWEDCCDEAAVLTRRTTVCHCGEVVYARRQRNILAKAIRDTLTVDGEPYEDYSATVRAILKDALAEAGLEGA